MEVAERCFRQKQEAKTKFAQWFSRWHSQGMEVRQSNVISVTIHAA